MRRLGFFALPAVLAAGAIAVLPGGSEQTATAQAPPTLDLRDVLDERISASGTAEGSCFRRERSGTGIVTRQVRVPAGVGHVRAVLDGDRGDWDVAVFDSTGRAVAAAASSRADEVAAGWTTEGGTLHVQACRLSDDAGPVQLAVEHAPVPATAASEAPRLQLVDVHTPTRADRNRLASLGVDLTGHASPGHRGVLLHGPDDEARLREAGFAWRIRDPDVAATDEVSRRQSREYARRTTRSALPTGRDSYRRYADYQQELKTLAEQNPDIVRLVTLPNRTWEGRTVEGIEISTNVNDRDGKPVFLQMGVHHAREWPSGEHAIEWAHELVNGFRSGDARARRLLEQTRTIVVPIVNPDGFVTSREAASAAGLDESGREGPNETANLTLPYEYHRKNCRRPDDDESATCQVPGNGVAHIGVDPNRNYGGFWGGAGASGNQAQATYYGPAPFSEPETRNVRHLVSTRHVVTLISNHTFSDLVLRPPGLQAQGTTVDEENGYRALGDAMAAQNGYISAYSYQLYDTTGTTEDWSYYATGGFGFTFEIGCDNLDPDPTVNCLDGHFHPAYNKVVAEWEGTSPIAEARGDGGNREAYYIASESTANPARHSVLEGETAPGTVLRLRKTFQTPTSQENEDGSVRTFEDTLDTSMVVPSSGRVEWHVNPSTRPLVGRQVGREARGDASAPIEDLDGSAPAVQPPPPSCANFETPPPGCFTNEPFTIPGGPGVDNAFAEIRIEFNAGADFDLKVFRDRNGNGEVDAADGPALGTSGNGATNATFGEEQVVLGPDPEPGQYVAQVIAYAAPPGTPYDGRVTFRGPLPVQRAQTEAWTLSCERDGRVLGTQQVVVARGQRGRLDLSACAASRPTEPTRPPLPVEPSCSAGSGFRSVGARRSGRRGVRFEFNRRVNRPVQVDVFQQSVGRRVIGERLVARFTNRTRSFTWNGRANRRGRRTTDGYYFARYRIRTPDGAADVRRVTLQRQNGRWRTRPSFYRRATCDALPSFKLERPVFGGPSNRALGISFRVAESSRVRVTVLRGRRVVRRYLPANRRSGVTHRLRLRPEPLARGDYQVRIEVTTAAGRTLRTTLTSRRL